ncbi:MAG: SWIM zinc finger family protein [Acidobacteriota bacterium]|nr:SWIM zinc finger family protein [Acidobacteriota bacterium]
MFILKSKEQITRAIDNARKLHPKVKMIEFGEYVVTGSKGTTYTVLCYRAGSEKIVDCNCPSRVPCKHSAAALQVHIYMAATRGH